MCPMPAIKFKQDIPGSDADEMPTSRLGRTAAGKSPATALMELGMTLVGADFNVGILGLCRRCRGRRDKYATSQYPEVFCSKQCEQEFIRSALASLTLEDCIRIHVRLEGLLEGAAGTAV
jgi:hypothetical protein